jgi:hypothetical protein
VLVYVSTLLFTQKTRCKTYEDDQMRSIGRPLAVRVIIVLAFAVLGSTMADRILKNMYGMNEEEKHIKAKQLKEQLGYFLFKVQTHGGRGTS